MKNISVIQLGELKEVLNSLIAIESLAESSKSNVYFFVNYDFVFLKNVFPNVCNFIFTKIGTDQKPDFKHLHAQGINNLEFDITYNLSFNESSVLLAQYLNSSLYLGLNRDLEGNYLADDPWTRVLLSQSDSIQCIHDIDIYRFIINSASKLQWPSAVLEGILTSEHPKIYISYNFKSKERLNRFLTLLSENVHGVEVFVESEFSVYNELTNVVAFKPHEVMPEEKFNLIQESCLCLSGNKTDSCIASILSTYVVEFFDSNYKQQYSAYGNGHVTIYGSDCDSEEKFDHLTDIIREFIELCLTTEDGKVPNRESLIDIFSPLTVVDNPVAFVEINNIYELGTSTSELKSICLAKKSGIYIEPHHGGFLANFLIQNIFLIAFSDYEEDIPIDDIFYCIDDQAFQTQIDIAEDLAQLSRLGSNFSSIANQYHSSGKQYELENIGGKIQEIDNLIQKIQVFNMDLSVLVKYYQVMQFYNNSDTFNDISNHANESYIQLNKFVDALLELINSLRINIKKLKPNDGIIHDGNSRRENDGESFN